ncbi:MAG TPA: hypothetical protein ENK02_01610 [Planctomycetes bacterium]|nr:hypothetical protein [Planctomycetota bacterium]
MQFSSKVSLSATSFFFFLSSFLSSGLSAQTTVSPKEFKNTEGASSNYFPYFRASTSQTFRQMHYQEVHDLGTAKGAIKGLLYRRDGRVFAGSKSPASWTDVEIALSTAKTTAQTISKTFASNEGSNRVVVLKRKKVNFPSFPFLPAKPQPFFFSFPFDTNKVLAFTGGSVCLDVKTYDNSVYDAQKRTFNYIYFDAAFNSTGGTYERTGRACYGSDQNNILPFYGFTYTSLITSTNTLRLYSFSYNGLSGGTGIMLVAAKKLASPVKLPGSCFLYVDPSSILMMVPGTGVIGSRKTTTYYYPPYQGNTRQYINIPFSNSLRNVQIQSQMVGFDPGANSLGWTFTNLNTVNLPNYNPKGLSVSRVYRNGSSAFTSTTGFVNKSFGLITTFKM